MNGRHSLPGFEFEGDARDASRPLDTNPAPHHHEPPAAGLPLFDAPWPGLFDTAPFGTGRFGSGLFEMAGTRQVRARFRLRDRTLLGVVVLLLIILGIVVGTIVSANNGPRGAGAVPARAFLPATPAGQDFTPYAAGSTRGITQSQGRMASVGAEIVAVSAESGQRVPRAQFFVSVNEGRSWSLGTVTAAAGGTPPPGHAARFVAGGQGEWAAIGPDSIWTSGNGREWTLASAHGLPSLAGDRVTVLKRTSAGFIAAGANLPDGDQARATPVIFLSASGNHWHRLGASQLRLAAGPGRALDIRLAAADGNRILIAGDVATPRTAVTGTSSHTVIVRTGGAWLSGDGGRIWTRVPVPAGHGAQAEFSDAAATANGLLLVRPATVDGVPAADIYRSANGTTWTFTATLTTRSGFVPGLMNSSPDGAVLAGRSGQTLTAFVSPDGVTWRQTGAFGNATANAVSGVAATSAGAVIAAGSSAAVPGSSQQFITLAGPPNGARMLSLAAIPGATEPQLAVNAIAAHARTEVVAGGANGRPAAWISSDGGNTWHRTAGQTLSVLDRPGIQQLTSVTRANAGWLAVGGVIGGAAEHPVVLVSRDGSIWSAADRERAFTGRGPYTRQAAGNRDTYVIVGYQQATSPQTAAAWWSAGLTSWHRASVVAASRRAGGTRMLAVTVSGDGFVAVGSRGTRPAIWTTHDGRTWTEADLPLPAGATSAVLQQIAAYGRTVVAAGTLRTPAGQLPFAARSSDGGSTWNEVGLPVPAGTAQVTALVAAGRSFTATGTFGSTPGHQDVVVWTSPNGATWQAATPAGLGLAGPGIQAITGLAVSGGTLTGVGFTATPAGEQPTFWPSLTSPARLR